ncbi:hypothetical protein K6L27_05280 [Burkholderia cenocepacia]|uniref:hypothetical protein n=1 Tax=Burkholderia cenocepacia TaxID=95486 RepID=UPI002230FD0A|nr:hypothetical protein [Burkholderia cenocepacia]MCW3657580.1 hypothetical protein [Burkholderia cenocepacia]
MPIKPENRGRYPANWPEIRARILARAGNCCEQCRVANGDTIVRGIDKDAGTFQRAAGPLVLPAALHVYTHPEPLKGGK